jgi:hypothetical protein
MAQGRDSRSMAWSAGPQPVVVDFTAGRLVEDAGLLAVRQLDVRLGVLPDLAQRLPDPRAPLFVQHPLESLIVQFVCRSLAGCPDGNDATDDPVHGRQPLSACHGCCQQHQHHPLPVFDGQSGMPLACWLRPGTAHAACGADDVLRRVVERLRQAWPDAVIRVRGDGGLSVPAALSVPRGSGPGLRLRARRQRRAAASQRAWAAGGPAGPPLLRLPRPAVGRLAQAAQGGPAGPPGPPGEPPEASPQAG